MNVQQLQQEMLSLKIPDYAYSLNGYLKLDALVLHTNYTNWQVFYFSERGTRHDEKVFQNEFDACEYFLKKFKSALETAEKHGIRAF